MNIVVALCTGIVVFGHTAIVNRRALTFITENFNFAIIKKITYTHTHIRKYRIYCEIFKSVNDNTYL